ncbi:hypothetical protein M405DRAFT_937207 [Rhizopogon salebrosus TDB-379]|nr:hypothetical protein M405DRAFT_937207 [Rhizopogon salebrosus TDB-379]
MPPLQLIEEEWGGTKDNRMEKGHRQVWRPHNDNNVRRQWSQFMFFVTQVRAAMDNDKNVLQAVHELDEKRGALSLPRFHAQTRPKGRRNPIHSQAPSQSPVVSASQTPV